MNSIKNLKKLLRNILNQVSIILDDIENVVFDQCFIDDDIIKQKRTILQEIGVLLNNVENVKATIDDDFYKELENKQKEINEIKTQTMVPESLFQKLQGMVDICEDVIGEVKKDTIK